MRFADSGLTVTKLVSALPLGLAPLQVFALRLPVELVGLLAFAIPTALRPV